MAARSRFGNIVLLFILAINTHRQPSILADDNLPAPSETSGQDPLRASASGEEFSSYQELQSLYSKAAYEDLLKKCSIFEQKYPMSKWLAQIHNFRGLAYLLTKRALQAEHYFQKSLLTPPQAILRPFILYNLATAQLEQNHIEQADETLKNIEANSLDKENRAKFHFMRSKVFAKSGLFTESARELLLLGRISTDTRARGHFSAQLNDVLQQIVNVVALESLYKEFEDSMLADLLLFKLGSLEIASGRTDAAKTHLNSLMERFPQSAHYAEAADLLHSLQSQSVVDPLAVGVLLPLKGKFSRYGTASLQGVELAFRIFNTSEPASKVTLVLEDTGEDPEQAVRALNKLLFNHHVIAVIGPLLSKGVDLVTQRAQELGLPLITLSQQPGVLGDFIFQAGLTPKLQTLEIAGYAIEKLGLKKFAIAHPNDRFGEQYSQLYWDAVETLGGEIVGIESYKPGETDFRQVVDKLAGLHYTEARQRELDTLEKEREANNIKKRTRKTEQFYGLKPIIDFEAVFIPDEPKVVGQLLPTFAYRDVDGVRFLGISTWNSPELVSRAQKSAEGAFFTDAIYTESEAPAVKKFTNRYRATFDQDPGAVEAMAYDAASLLEHVLISGEAKDRNSVREQLHSISGFQGVTGKISFKDGQFIRGLTILTVKEGTITEVGK